MSLFIPPPLVSIVILNYNGKKFLKNCLLSVSKTDYKNFEVIVVDNGSTDGSDELALNELGLLNIRLVKNCKNLGFAEGNNVGVRYSKGEYIVFLNNDTEIDPNWLKNLIGIMESDPKIGVAQSNLLQSDRKTIDSTGDFMDYYANAVLRGHGEKAQVQSIQSNNTGEIFSARGAAMVVRKQVFEAVGCFDASFFMMFEDVDLSWRVRLYGLKVVFVPQSVVYHFGSATRKNFQSLSKSCYYTTRNSLIAMIKNYNLKNLICYGFIKLFFQFVIFLSSLPFKSKRGYNYYKLIAFLSVFKNFGRIWQCREKVQFKVRKISDNDIKEHLVARNISLLEITWFASYRQHFSFERYLNKVIF